MQHGPQSQIAFLSSGAVGTPTVDQIQSQIKANALPIFRAPIDSGCTATCTNVLAHLVNTRPCDELFDAANGEKCKCDTIGDMPVLAKRTPPGRYFASSSLTFDMFPSTSTP